MMNMIVAIMSTFDDDDNDDDDGDGDDDDSDNDADLRGWRAMAPWTTSSLPATTDLRDTHASDPSALLYSRADYDYDFYDYED